MQAARGLRGDLHEFVITDRDTALLTSYVITRADLRASAARATARSRTRSSRRSTSPAARCCSSGTASITSRSTSPTRRSKPDWDFFHLNSVDLDGDGNLLVSSRNTHTVYKLDRAGAIIWRLGGKRSDFEMGAGRELRLAARRPPPARRHDHDFRQRRHPGGRELSRGLILNVDEQAMMAALVRQYTHPKILSGSQGNVQVLPNGNVFIGWGEVPRVSEFDRSGRMLFDAVLGEKYSPTGPFACPGAACPRTLPAIAAHRRRRGGDDRVCELEWGDRRPYLAIAGGRPWPALSRPWRSTPSRGFESALRSSSPGPVRGTGARRGWRTARPVAHRHGDLNALNRAGERGPDRRR